MFKSKEIAELTTKIETLEAEKTALTEQLGTANASLATAQEKANQLAGVQTELETARGTITAHEATIATHAGLIAAKDAELKAKDDAMEATIRDQVNSRCAAAGLETPIARDPAAGAKADDTKATPGAGLTGRAKAAAILAAKGSK